MSDYSMLSGILFFISIGCHYLWGKCNFKKYIKIKFLAKKKLGYIPVALEQYNHLKHLIFFEAVRDDYLYRILNNKKIYCTFLAIRKVVYYKEKVLPKEREFFLSLPKKLVAWVNIRMFIVKIMTVLLVLQFILFIVDKFILHL